MNEKELINSKLENIEIEVSILKKDHERWIFQLNYFSELFKKIQDNNFAKNFSIPFLRKELESIFNETGNSQISSLNEDNQKYCKLSTTSKNKGIVINYLYVKKRNEN